jgi:hypothetical protein
LLRRSNLHQYGQPPLVVAFGLIGLNLFYSSQDQVGAIGGYGGAALLLTVLAFWLQRPILLTPASILGVVPYAIGLERSGLPRAYYGLALLPGALLALVLGRWLDDRFGAWGDFPWAEAGQWPVAVAKRLWGWWALPLYGLGYGLALAAPFFTAGQAGLAALNWLLLIPLLGWAIYRFRLRIWLLALAGAGHLAAALWLAELGWWYYPVWAWLRFLPLPLVMAIVARVIEVKRGEGSPLILEQMFRGWSRPLYIILLLDIIIGQGISLEGNWPAATITLVHTVMIAGLASSWRSQRLPYLSLMLGVYAFLQAQAAATISIMNWPVSLSYLAVGYGIVGYGLGVIRLSLSADREVRPWLAIWELPLQRLSLIVSGGTLVLTGLFGLEIVNTTGRALYGLPFRHLIDPALTHMVITVFALLGILYLAIAFIHRWLSLGYLASGMLLLSWTGHMFYIRQWEDLQFYAIPTGLYLLGMAYLEWQRGHKAQGQWLDYMGLILMMGSLFWQTLLYGWVYALLLGSEALLILWWGSARRLRRFLYAGMGGMVLATLGQLINSLWSINQWIVFGVVGLMLVILAVVIERKLDEIKLWQKSLEAWE